jgi:hypothetical protein
MSGSPHFDAINHRMIIAPLSTAWGWSRQALSMRDLLYWGYVNPAFDPAAQGPTVNEAQVAALGLTPANYYGWADEELDWEFDVQRDLERLRGEKQRGWYWLGFESLRRNALWDLQPIATLDTNNRWAALNRTTGTGFAEAMRHPRLDLAAGTYRVSLMANTVSSATSYSLFAGLYSGSSYVSGEWVNNVAGAGWQMFTFEVTAPAAGTSLVLGLWGTADIQVSAVTLVKQGEPMDFDTFDKRTAWRNDISGARATVVPDGRVTGTPNWAVRVAYDPTAPLGYPVRNRQLALVGGRSYRICFDTRRDGTAPVTGELRVMSSGAAAVVSSFTAPAAWGNVCTSTFTVPTDDNNLQLRAASPNGVYLVDNLTITPL